MHITMVRRYNHVLGGSAEDVKQAAVVETQCQQKRRQIELQSGAGTELINVRVLRDSKATEKVICLHAMPRESPEGISPRQKTQYARVAGSSPNCPF